MSTFDRSVLARLTSRSGQWGPTLALGLILGYFVVVPIVVLFVSSVKPEGFPTDTGFTLDNYRDVYTDPSFVELLFNTLAFVIGSSAIALVLGILLAWLVERTDLPAKKWVRGFVILPMATPPLLLAIAWIMLLSPRSGFFNMVLMDLFGLQSPPFDIFGLGGMIFVEGLALVPTTFLMLAPAFRSMDPNLEQAALVSGASMWTVIRRVVLPMLRPAILAAAAFIAIAGFVVFDIPGAIGMPNRVFVLSSQVFSWVSESPTGLPLYGKVSALAVFFLIVLVFLGLVYQQLTKQSRRFVTVTGKAYQVHSVSLGRWRWAAMAFVFVYFLLAVIAPGAILVWTSCMPYQAKISLAMLSELTFANHMDFLSNPEILTAVRNSVTIAAIAGFSVVALSAIVSWVVIRTQAYGRKIIDLLAFMPIGIPGVMIGVALIYVYLSFSWFPIYGTIWIIIIAYTTTYLSYGSRATSSVMLQLHSELEEAARTSGAGWWRVFRKIVLPLILPALIAVWIWVVAHAARELSAALMLHGRSNTVITTLLWDYWSGGEPNKAATVGVWLMVTLSGLVVLWQIMSGRVQNARPSR